MNFKLPTPENRNFDENFDEFDWGKLGVEATGIKFLFEKALPQYESLKYRKRFYNKQK